MKTIFMTATALLALSGCATSSIETADAKPVPQDRIFVTEQPAQAGNATAFFVRDVGFTGAGVYQHLFINGRKAASLNPGEKVRFTLVPGEYILGVIPTDPFGTHALNTIDQELKADKQYFYRIQTDGNSFRTVIQRYLPEPAQ